MTEPSNNVNPNATTLQKPCTHTQLLGHRGARDEKPENTQAGFEHLHRLFNQQVTQQQATYPSYRQPLLGHPSNVVLAGVEFDVQMTADNTLVVFHDDNLSRIFGLQSRIDEISLTRLQQMTQNRVALLTDMPNLLQGYTHIEMEVKTHARTNHRLLANAIFKALAHPSFLSLPITITSFDTHLHTSLQNYADAYGLGYKRGLIVDPRFGTNRMQTCPMAQQELIIATALRLGCQHISWQYGMITPRVITQCRQQNMGISAWTVNHLKTGKHLADMGVDYLITDCPSRFMGYSSNNSCLIV